MIEVGNQSDLKKKKKLPTANSETLDLCKPTTTTEAKKKKKTTTSRRALLNLSWTDLKKTQYCQKKKKTEKPDAVSKL
jgi:hypothetical protein